MFGRKPEETTNIAQRARMHALERELRDAIDEQGAGLEVHVWKVAGSVTVPDGMSVRLNIRLNPNGTWSWS